MRTRLWFVVLVLGATACGGGTVATTAATSEPTSTVEAAATNLSGLSFDVHQAPG